MALVLRIVDWPTFEPSLGAREPASHDYCVHCKPAIPSSIRVASYKALWQQT